MAFLSEILSEVPGIPQQYKEQASICLMCGEKNERGGMWATYRLHTSVCKKCAPSLLDWYIDTLLDGQEINESDDIANIKRLSNDIICRYEKKKLDKVKHNKKHM